MISASCYVALRTPHTCIIARKCLSTVVFYGALGFVSVYFCFTWRCMSAEAVGARVALCGVSRKAITHFSAQGATSWGSRFLARIEIRTRPKSLIKFIKFFCCPLKPHFRMSSSSHPTAKMAGSRFAVGVILPHRANGLYPWSHVPLR